MTHQRAAGALYLVTHVTSVLAVVAYGADEVAAGVTLELALALACSGTGVLLWTLLKDDGPARAATFAALRGVEASVILAGTLPMVAAMWHPGSADLLEPLHTASFLVGQGLVIGANTVVLGSLLLGSRRAPAALGALGMAGGAIVLTSDLAQLWGAIPLNGLIAAAAAVPVFAFELWLAFLLLLGRLRPTPTSVAEARFEIRA